MNLLFRKIHLHSFLSFGDAEILLDDNGYVFVQGRNENPADSAYSNGSGKSSIWEGISWVLTGETIRGTKDVVNINTTDGCFVEIWFNCDGKEYYILRSKNSDKYKTNLKVIIDDKDVSGKGIRDTDKLLKEYLPDLTSDFLGSVILLGQGLPQRFSNNSPSGRKQTLEALTKSDYMIDDLKKRVMQRKSELLTQRRSFEDAILSYTSSKTIYNSQLVDTQRQLDTLGNADAYESAVNELREKLQKSIDILGTLQAQVDELSTKYATTNEKYSALSFELNNKLAAIRPMYESTLNNLSSEITLLNAQAYALQQEISRLESVQDVCPTCGQKLPNVLKVDTTDKRNELLRLQEDIRIRSRNKQETEEKIKQDETQLRLQYNLEISNASADLRNLSTAITTVHNNLRNEMQNKSQIEQRIESIMSSIEMLETSKKALGETITQLTEKITEADEKILYNTNEKNTLLEHINRLDKFDTLLARDFRGYLLGNVIEYINIKAKEYAKEVFGTESIDFVLSGNDIDINYNGRPLEALSGGERQKVDLIVQFSIRDMLCNFMSFSSNILILDEIFDNLDTVGCQKILDLISRRLQSISSIYIVSHHNDLMCPYDTQILVVKNASGISEIRN